eukprot:6623758-Prymnesium_polylepis.1
MVDCWSGEMSHFAWVGRRGFVGAGVLPAGTTYIAMASWLRLWENEPLFGTAGPRSVRVPPLHGAP